MRGIKLTGLFASVGRKVTDQILINKAKNIIVLFSIGGDIFDQLNQFADGLGLAAGAVAQFAQAGFQCVKDFAEYLLLCFADQTVKSRKSCSDIVYSETIALRQPSREKIVVSDKITQLLLAVSHNFRVIFMHILPDIIFAISIFLQAVNFFV